MKINFEKLAQQLGLATALSTLIGSVSAISFTPPAIACGTQNVKSQVTNLKFKFKIRALKYILQIVKTMI